MKIGFDISQTGNAKAGCGFVADSLILALTEVDQENEYILYPYFGSDFWDPDAKKNTRKIFKSNISRKEIITDFSKSKEFWKDIPSDGEHRLGNPDIIHANNFFCPIGISKAKIVYTLHDISFLAYPEFTTEANRWICFNGVFNASNNADFIISVSSYSQNKFLEFFPHFPSDRIKTIHLGSRFSSKDDVKDKQVNNLISDQFWLCVGTLEPRKNLRRLLKGFSNYKEKVNSVYPLVLAGGKGWMEDDLKEYINNLDLKKDVIVLGYVTDEELLWLYKNCFAFIYPSLYEGFGLPVLEAMSMGAPVITSNLSSLPEVAGNAAYYVDPYKIEDITDAFSRISKDSDYRLSLKNFGIKQSQKFSWKKCASEVLKIYNDVVKMPKR